MILTHGVLTCRMGLLEPDKTDDKYSKERKQDIAWTRHYKYDYNPENSGRRCGMGATWDLEGEFSKVPICLDLEELMRKEA